MCLAFSIRLPAAPSHTFRIVSIVPTFTDLWPITQNPGFLSQLRLPSASHPDLQIASIAPSLLTIHGHVMVFFGILFLIVFLWVTRRAVLAGKWNVIHYNVKVKRQVVWSVEGAG